MNIMRKPIAIVSIAASALFFTSCDSTAQGEANITDSVTTTTEVVTAPPASALINLETGNLVKRDDATGKYTDESGTPVRFYVDMNAMDTFYASNDLKVNNVIIRENDVWELDETKVKIDGDEVKIKYADGSKMKLDEDGSKYKSGDTKIKTENGSTKIKTGDTKIKSGEDD
jgi:hypothetical protein